MADAGSCPKLQRLSSEVPPNHANASKFYYNFLYKAVIVTIFLVILPLFSSQAPEFINQNLHNRSWELLQLIFVGIAVSYGLFSKRSEETEKEHSSKFDNAQSYVSRLLQVSSVFDDEAENPSAFDENKIQTWNSQYYRGEPVVVVAKENSIYEQRAASSQIGKKPLLLPVRSLKSLVSEPDIVETTKETSIKAGSHGRSSSGSGSKRFSSNANKFRNGELEGVSPLNLERGEENVIHRSGSKRFSGNTNKFRNEEFGGLSPLNLEEEVEESVVHRSPIPWRSRSGRMEMKEDVDGPPLYPISPSVENSESNRLQSRSFGSLSSKSSRVESNSSSPKKLSPSPSLSSARKLSPLPSWSLESQTKSIEDVVRKKSSHRSSPTPPPPPPPPPSFIRKSTVMKSNSIVTNDEVTPVKELRRSIRSVPMEFSYSESVEQPRRVNSGSELRAGAQSDGSFMSKSVRTIRPFEALTKVVKANEFGENDATFIEKREYTDKLMHEKFPTMSKRTFMEFPEKEKQEYLEKVLVETDDDTEAESEDDYFEEVPTKEEVSSSKEEAATDPVSDGGPDVDKKADEFIAKFREQIRLQRIESIRRSTRQHVRNHSR